jgi:sarcosine oxidase subunit beta
VADGRRTADVAIVGGGIIGLSIALELAGRGLRVVVLDRSLPGAAASSRNGGGVRQQGRAVPEIGLAGLAMQRWAGLADKLGGPTGYRRIGHLMVAADEDQMVALRERQQLEKEHGLETVLVDEGTVQALAPGLARGFIGGKLCPTDGMAVPALTMQSLTAAARRAGVTVLAGTAVRTVRTQAGAVTGVDADGVCIDAPLVVNAAGPWSSAVAATADVYLPVLPSRIHMFRTRPVAEKVADVWVATAALDFNGVQWEDGSVLFGGAVTTDPTQYTYDLTPRPEKVAEGVFKLGQALPALRDTPLECSWTGIREFTPDMIPIIGPAAGVDGLFLCTGFSGHGFALGPLIGELVAGWLASGERPDVLAPFDPERFVDDRSPFNYPAAPWGGATTSLQVTTVPDVPPIDLADVPLGQHSGAPTTIDHPPFEELP